MSMTRWQVSAQRWGGSTLASRRRMRHHSLAKAKADAATRDHARHRLSTVERNQRSEPMGYTDAHGRPELVVHPDIVRGFASYRHVDTDEGAPPEAATARAKRRESSPARRRSEELGRQRNAAAGTDGAPA
jgi:hypothetical protein